MHFTKREAEIMDLICQGMGNKQIAASVGTSEQTIKNQVSFMLTKFNVSNRTALAVSYIGYQPINDYMPFV